MSKDGTDIVDLNVKLLTITREKFDDLTGRPITIAEASQKYGVHRNTVFLWATRYQYVKILKPGYRIAIDEADVAYCADIYTQRKRFGGSGSPLLNKNGTPCLLKHPTLSASRRRKKALRAEGTIAR